MKIQCIKKMLLGQEIIDATGYSYTQQLEYPVTIGKEYLVMGIILYKGTNYLHYLVDDYNRPFWCPYTLFHIIDHKLPVKWFANTFNPNETGGAITFLSGFYELCMDYNFDAALMEREEWALKIYHDRKNELLKQSEVEEFIKKSKNHINIGFERWKLLELFDEEHFEASEGQTIDYILRTDDNNVLTLYIAPFDGYAIITLKRADTLDIISEMEIDNVYKIDCTETALLFYKNPDRKENNSADIVVTVKPKSTST